MGEVAETERDTSQVLEPAVDRLHRTVGCAGIEVGQDLFPEFSETATELSELRKLFGDTGFDAFEGPCASPTSRPAGSGLRMLRQTPDRRVR